MQAFARNYFAVGHSGKCFNIIKDWVEKKVRRHLARAQKRKGFSWRRWSKPWLCNTLGLFNAYRVQYDRLKVAPTRHDTTRHDRSINLEVKRMGERSAENPHAAFDATGAGNVARSDFFDRSWRVSSRPYHGRGDRGVASRTPNHTRRPAMLFSPGKGLPQVLGSCGYGHRRVRIVSRLESLSKARAESTIINSATDLKQ